MLDISSFFLTIHYLNRLVVKKGEDSNWYSSCCTLYQENIKLSCHLWCAVLIFFFLTTKSMGVYTPWTLTPVWLPYRQLTNYVAILKPTGMFLRLLNLGRSSETSNKYSNHMYSRISQGILSLQLYELFSAGLLFNLLRCHPFLSNFMFVI